MKVERVSVPIRHQPFKITSKTTGETIEDPALGYMNSCRRCKKKFQTGEMKVDVMVDGIMHSECIECVDLSDGDSAR